MIIIGGHPGTAVFLVGEDEVRRQVENARHTEVLGPAHGRHGAHGSCRLNAKIRTPHEAFHAGEHRHGLGLARHQGNDPPRRRPQTHLATEGIDHRPHGRRVYFSERNVIG